MSSSDSEGFESADEGNNTPIKRERKKRLSSSNYSDNISDYETKKNTEKAVSNSAGNQSQATDGWDNWGDDASEPVATKEKVEAISKTQDVENSGWDDFDDWGDTDVISTDKPTNTNQSQHSTQKPQAQKQPLESHNQEQDIKSVTDRLAATTTKSDGWGWGWGVDSLLSTASAGLSTATAGLSTITSQVSQGISTVLETVETGIGAPDPEELARRAHQNKESESKEVEPKTEESTNATTPNEASFPFGSLFSGVTKFVENTGTKVISGGLDTLETIGKKTMEVLQEGDPLLAKKRAMLGLDAGDKPVLSQLLREAKEKADEEDKVKEAKREAKEVHYETLFDDYEGLIHLEALEMLSKQVSMRIEERLRSTPVEKRQDMKETLQQVAELCEMPEEDEDDDDEDDETSLDTPKPEAFHEKLQKATKDIGLKLQFQPLIKHYSDVLDAAGTDLPARGVYKRAVGSLAACTALGVQLYHKTGEMLLVKPRRSTADEADALTQMTVVLTKHISELATLFTEKLNACTEEDQQQVNNYITNVFLEAGNSSKYIENAFQLTLPIIQIGAV
ncbi:protein FAM114A2 isoform X2 [Aricia agestis]|uniref:protein FAM114A2 isoform X2 n=1 Tax=Aricia agestis TaxID=91739 RepID=UPI001C2025B7|nr:protein FAM114A2 isoform X2 [Aricia agestis]